ncbi:MAG: response regulator [Deltaproteobacteria bacterium]|nr:response regulator [Deltaproteobacteria bacterium]
MAANDLLWQQLRAGGLLTEEGASAARARVATSGEDFASACWALRLVPERDLARVLARLCGYPGIDLSACVLKLANLELIPEDVIRRQLVLPVLDSGYDIVIAMAEPDDSAVYDQLRFLTGRKVLRHVVVPGALRAVIEGVFKSRLAGAGEWRGREAWKLDPPPEGCVAFVHPSAEPAGAAAPAAEGAMPGLVGGVIAEVGERWLDGIFGGMEMPARAGAPLPAPAQPKPAIDARTTLKMDQLGVGTTVLVVDDDPEMRAMEAKLLEPFGCAVVQTGDGREALALARELKPDAILLDAMLPGMHGFEVCRAIKGDPALRGVGIAMISGIYTGWRIGADLKEAYGADYFFEKPFRIPEVSRAIRVLLLGGAGAEVLSRARRQEALATCHEALERAHTGRHSEAIGLLQAATQKDPFSAEPHFFLGQVLRQANQPYQAVAALERAAELRPDLDQPLTMLGELYLALGFRKTARDVLLRAREACADPLRARQIEARLAELGRA